MCESEGGQEKEGDEREREREREGVRGSGPVDLIYMGSLVLP